MHIPTIEKELAAAKDFQELYNIFTKKVGALNEFITFSYAVMFTEMIHNLPVYILTSLPDDFLAYTCRETIPL